jgi:hypothetical protein
MSQKELKQKLAFIQNSAMGAHNDLRIATKNWERTSNACKFKVAGRQCELKQQKGLIYPSCNYMCPLLEKED